MFSRVFGAVLLALITLFSETAWGNEGFSTDDQHCWFPALLNGGRSVALRQITATDAKAIRPLELHFNSQVPVEAKKADGTDLVAGEKVEEIRLTAEAGNLSSPDSNFALVDGSASFLVTPRSFVELVPSANTKVKLSSETTVRTDGKLPAVSGTVSGTSIKAKLASSAELKPLAMNGLIGGINSEQWPSAVPPNSLKVTLSAPGVDFSDPVVAGQLRACAKTPSTVTATPAAISSIEAKGMGSAIVTVSLPGNLFGSGNWNSVSYGEGKIGILLTDGSYYQVAGFKTAPPSIAILAALLVLVVGNLLILTFTDKEPAGSPSPKLQRWLRWFTPQGRPTSISLFQIYLWTWVVLAGSTYVALLTGELLSVTPEVLALLGIAGTGSVTARFVAVAQDRSQKNASIKPKFADIFKTDGEFDLYKLQMFFFTVGVAIYVSIRIIVYQAFPQLDANLLLLLGISNGIYVGGKVASSPNPFREAERLDTELKILQVAKDNATTSLATIEKKITETSDEITNAQTNSQPVQTLLEQKALLEVEKAAATQRLKDVEAKMVATSAARTKAIEKLS